MIEEAALLFAVLVETTKNARGKMRRPLRFSSILRNFINMYTWFPAYFDNMIETKRGRHLEKDLR